MGESRVNVLLPMPAQNNNIYMRQPLISSGSSRWRRLYLRRWLFLGLPVTTQLRRLSMAGIPPFGRRVTRG